MTGYRKTTLLNHIRNLIGPFNLILIGFIISILFYSTDFNKGVIFIFGIPIILSLIPVVLIHLNYNKVDRRKSVRIDKEKPSVTISENGVQSKITQSDIQSTIFTTGFEGSASLTWSGYFYYQIKLESGMVIYLTSLILKKKDLPFDVNEKRHVAFPFVKYYKLGSKNIKEEKSRQQDEVSEVERYYMKYSKYSLSELKYIVDNEHSFQSAAVEAAKRLIEVKFTVANK